MALYITILCNKTWGLVLNDVRYRLREQHFLCAVTKVGKHMVMLCSEMSYLIRYLELKMEYRTYDTL